MTAQRDRTDRTQHLDRRPGRRRAALVASALGVALVATLLPATATAAPSPIPRKIVTGWMPYWTSATSTASVVANADLFNEVSPFWYSAQWAAGTSSVAELVPAGSKDSVLAQLRAAGVKIVPSVTDGMPTRQMAAVMANPAARATLVAQLVAVAVSNNYDGLDLDFEKFAFNDGSSTWPTTSPSWVGFVAALSAGLHAHGKILAVTTPPIYDAARTSKSGYWVYDWAGIARYADRLRIMAYDYSVSVPGPIAPFAWVERIVAFAVTQVPSGKVQVGVPTYGRDWTRRDAANKYLVTGVCPVNNPPSYSTKAFSASTAPTVLANRGLTAAAVTLNPTYLEQMFRYSQTYAGITAAGVATSCTVFREVWYDDAAAVAARATLVGKYQLAGIAAWTLGGEDPGQWGRLRSYATSIAPTPASITVVAPKMVGFRQPLTITGRVVAAGLPVTGAPATLFFRRAGTKVWIRMADGSTSSSGVASFRSLLPGHGEYRIYVGGAYDRTSAAANVAVQAKSAVTVTPSASSVRAGKAATVTVTMLPRIRGQLVVRQILTKGKWVTVAKTNASRSGVATFVVAPPGRNTTSTFRVIAAATGTYGSGTATFTVRAR